MCTGRIWKVNNNRQTCRKENESFNGLITWWSTWSHRDTHFLIIGARRNMHGKPHTLGTLVRKGYQSCTSGNWRRFERKCTNANTHSVKLWENLTFHCHDETKFEGLQMREFFRLHATLSYPKLVIQKWRVSHLYHAKVVTARSFN